MRESPGVYSSSETEGTVLFSHLGGFPRQPQSGRFSLGYGRQPQEIMTTFNSTTAAVVGPSPAPFTLTGPYASSLHAERRRIALINTRERPGTTITTDYLNSVRNIDRIRAPNFNDDG